jgi:hypothetical protein
MWWHQKQNILDVEWHCFCRQTVFELNYQNIIIDLKKWEKTLRNQKIALEVWYGQLSVLMQKILRCEHILCYQN